MNRNHPALAHETLLHACAVQKSFIAGFLTAVDARRERLSGIAGRHTGQEEYHTCRRTQLAFNNKRKALESFWLDAFLHRCVLGVDQGIAALNRYGLGCCAHFENSISVSSSINRNEDVSLEMIFKPSLADLQIVVAGR